MSGQILPETIEIQPEGVEANYFLTLRDYMQQLLSGYVSTLCAKNGIDFTKVAYFETTLDASVIKLTMKDPEGGIPLPPKPKVKSS